ncbi:hypothetical protein ACAD32_00481 [Clavibacter nebraskensis]
MRSEGSHPSLRQKSSHSHSGEGDSGFIRDILRYSRVCFSRELRDVLEVKFHIRLVDDVIRIPAMGNSTANPDIVIQALGRLCGTHSIPSPTCGDTFEGDCFSEEPIYIAGLRRIQGPVSLDSHAINTSRHHVAPAVVSKIPNCKLMLIALKLFRNIFPELLRKRASRGRVLHDVLKSLGSEILAKGFPKSGNQNNCRLVKHGHVILAARPFPDKLRMNSQKPFDVLRALAETFHGLAHACRLWSLQRPRSPPCLRQTIATDRARCCPGCCQTDPGGTPRAGGGHDPCHLRRDDRKRNP